MSESDRPDPAPTDPASQESLLASAVSPLVQAAIATRELFLAYMHAGFTKDEAIKLVAEMIRHHQDGK